MISDQIRLLNLRKNKVIDAAGAQGGMGNPPRPGRRLPVAHRRLGRQRPGRSRHRPGLCVGIPPGIRHARRAAGEPRPRQGGQEAAKPAGPCRDRPAGPPAGDSAGRPSSGSRLGRAAAPRTPTPLCSRLCAPSAASTGSATNSVAARGRRTSRINLGGDLSHRRYARATSPRSSTSCGSSPGSASTPRQPRSIRLRADLVGLSFSWKAGEAYYLPVRGRWDLDVLDEHATLAGARPILNDPDVEKVGQNIKYDMLALERAGIELAGPITDTMILSYLLESGERNHNLDQLSTAAAGPHDDPDHRLDRQGKNQLRMDQVAVDRVTEYAGEDADATWRIEEILARQGPRRGALEPLCRSRTPIDRRAGADGGGRDRRGRRGGSSSSRTSSPSGWRRSRRRSMPWPAAPSTSIPAPQLRQVLFDELKLPSLQKTPERRAEHGAGGARGAGAQAPAFPRCLLEHRQLAKLKSTYLDALPGLVHPRGRPDPRVVQPGGRGDRPAQLERPQPPEHPGAHRGRPPDPPGVRRRPARAGGC